MSLTLYGYWRSLATFRVRVALNLKGLEYAEVTVDLERGDQFGEPFRLINPQNALPVLDHDGLHLTQSAAIVEYIDETWPGEPLLPADAAGRARVRSLAQIPTADVHPLIVPRVRSFLGNRFGIAEADRLDWIRHWFDLGSEAIEARLVADGSTGRFAHGDRIGVADVVLVSHVVGARLFAADLSRTPRLQALADDCLAHPAFARAHPLVQSGAPGVG